MSSGTPHDHCINTLKTIRDITRNRLEPSLSAREFQTLIVLLTYRNSTSFQCNPSIKRISEDMDCSRTATKNALNGLKSKGYIRTTTRRKYDSKENDTTQYWVMYDMEIVRKAFSVEESHDYLICYHDMMVDLYENYQLQYEIR
jgi:hypothetical protein